MRFHRNSHAVARHGNSRGSWLSDDRRFLFDNDANGWMILSSGIEGGAIDNFLSETFSDTAFPTRRDAAKVLEQSLVEGPMLPSYEEMQDEWLGQFSEALKTLKPETLLAVQKILAESSSSWEIQSKLTLLFLGDIAVETQVAGG